ncbi:MAG: GntR family transcriptional regulator [Bacteroidales bacterium]|nr:GntR family transcriptional regulator [Bacteroidales bacterium]
MLEIWKSHELKVVNVDGDKLFFDAGDYGVIQVENIDLVKQYEVGECESVFLYLDSDKKVHGCMGAPYVAVGEFGYLTCVATTKIGAFLDWGIEKDIFCPFKEQKTDLAVDEGYIVYVYIDESTNRAVASTKYTKYLDTNARPQLQEQQKVKALVTRRTSLGYNLIVENKYMGILYANEVFSELNSGDVIDVIVKKVRDDNKLDLRLYRNDAHDINRFENQIVAYLKKHRGVMSINDDSDPKIIYKTFGISKKNFKKALGALYRNRIVELTETGVKLVSE